MFGNLETYRRTTEQKFALHNGVEGTLSFVETQADHWYEVEAVVHHDDGRLERFYVDFTRFIPMSESLFKMWIDLGMPSRYDIRTNGPIYPEDLEIAWGLKNV